MDKDNKDKDNRKCSTSSGILRVDASRSRIVVQSPFEPSSPQPSVDRLSVSFAPDYDRSWSESDIPPPISPISADASSRVNLFNMEGIPGSPSAGGPASQGRPSIYDRNRLSVALSEEEDDDYSASMTAILQRRASVRKVKGVGKRRTSSPFDSDRRRSSVFTTSSGDTAITMEGEGGSTQEQIFENIRLHKEVLESVKQQPWEMNKKLKLVRQAKAYISQHEGQLQERLAQSKNTKDIMAGFNIVLMRYWQYIKREAANIGASLVPWELRIKEIESHFGSAVASYFTFLRWMFWVNIVTSAILVCFIIVPEILAADPRQSGLRKVLSPSEEKTSKHFSTLWEFEGILKYSPMFYGFYTNQAKTKEGFPLPLSFFVTFLAVYIYSFVAILRRMAANSRQSKLSEKEDECAFSWRLFTAWDYMIGNPETAFNRFASITMGFKEALLEEKEKKKDERNWKVICQRILANLLILGLLCSSAYAVALVVERSADVTPEDSWRRQNEITLTLTLITLSFPSIFELIGLLEMYHPRKQLRLQLARIMVLNFLNLYTLIFALFGKVIKMTEELSALRPNETTTALSLSTSTENSPCTLVLVDCTLMDDYGAYEEAAKQFKSILVFMANLTTMLPETDLTSVLLNNSTYKVIANSTYNLTEKWASIHNVNPRLDVTQLLNLTSLISNVTEFKETWAETIENENWKWTEPLDPNNVTSSSFFSPENRTTFVTSLPIVIKLLSVYIGALLPHLPKSTLPVSDSGFNSTRFPVSKFSTPFDEIGSSSTNGITYETGTSAPHTTVKERKKDRTKGRKYVKTTVPVVTPKPHRYHRHAQPKLALNEFDTDGTTAPDHTEPDERYYYWENREKGAGSGYLDPDVVHAYNSRKQDEDDDDSRDLKIGPNGQYGGQKSSTRGDIPGEIGEESTTPIPSTEPAPTESLDTFLTNVLTVVTMVMTHNATKTDEIDYSKFKEISKWITTLESVVETRKVTSPYNTTFGTSTAIFNVDDRGSKKCHVQICDNGSTIPINLAAYLNCTDATDTVCILENLLGPREDNCWIPGGRDCITTTEPPPTIDPNISIKLRKLCWETMFGQELVKLTVMDLVFTVGFILGLDFIRAIFVRVLNPCCCWDLEKRFPSYGDFKIAENILHLVNNQGMIWMGMFFSPGLPALNLFKLVILMYIRSWAVMTCNVPHETVFRASRSNNFYFALLLFMLFLCTLPVAYAVVWLEPSWHCGPFSEYQRIYHILTQAILNALPPPLQKVLDYIASPGIVIPLLVLLILVIYYLLSLTGALREANNDLKIQLRRERTEERRKMFKIAGGKNKDETKDLWRMILPMTTKKSDGGKGSGGGGEKPSILTTGKMTGFAGAAKRAALKTREMNKKSTAATATIGGLHEDDGNATDNDQASLSEENASRRSISGPHMMMHHRDTRKPSCTDSVASTRSEIPVIKISKEEDSRHSSPKPGTSRRQGSIDPAKRARVLKALVKKSKDEAMASSPEPDISDKS